MALVQLSYRAVQPAPPKAGCAKKLAVKKLTILVSKMLMHLVLMKKGSNIWLTFIGKHFLQNLSSKTNFFSIHLALSSPILMILC